MDDARAEPAGGARRAELRPHDVLAAAATARWHRLAVVTSTGSTNADLAAAARAGTARAGDVLVADLQTAGRGRLGRDWASPPRAGLTVSLLVAPSRVPAARWTWLPLLTGLSLAQGVDEATGGAVRPDLKWPNDLLVRGRKVAGVLVERVGESAVLGCGLNVSATAAELPPEATSLGMQGWPGDRPEVLAALLRNLDRWLARWEDARGDADAAGLRAAYAGRCVSLGREVRVELPGGSSRRGPAEAVDAEGRLVVAGSAVAAGDVVHLR